ncbi:MAG: hypothetical protein AAF331_15035, partial [Pseudomonadota bacterium]
MFAHADCPPEDSIDRYAQTAGDALTALHELVPESQQQALEDRYAAMIILKWQWQGRDAVRSDAKAMTQLLSCYQDATCGIRANDQITTQIVAKLEESAVDPLLLESLLPRQPSDRSLAWAERVLGCNGPAQPRLAPTTQVDTTQTPTTQTALLENEQTQIALTEPSRSTPTLADPLPADPPSVAQPVQQTDPFVPATQPRATSNAYVEPVVPAASSVLEATVSTAESQPLTAQVAAAPISVAQPASANVRQLMLTATNLVSSGKPQEAIAPLETACFIEARETRKSSACETLFSVYTNSLVASEYSDSSRAYRDLSQRLCDNGYSRGCDNLSRHYAAQNAPEAHRAAVSYAEKSCDLASAEACATVSNFYLAGRASEPDPSAARAKLEQSCELGRLISCQEVADYYLRGVGGDPDPAMALKMVEASCPAGSTERADLCVSAADFILINETPGEARSA